ncbi:MAG: Trk family potassium uptake protein [Lachnospiraceae bacterium]|jgi:trk system potassium uptake protein TrkH|nr:Trk family potassium uptake protein [Lachnospiraceae bacterium]
MRQNKSAIRIEKIITPMRIIFISYILIIFIGGVLLSFPLSRAEGEKALPFFDYIFTATSAVCVTGLVVVPTADYWSLFGQIVILALIQIGGLGMITITGFILVITGRKIGFKDRILIQNSLNQNHMGGMVKLTKIVISGTLLFEGAGALLLSLHFFFIERLGFLKSIYYGVFHAISAFCNAGFDVIGIDSLERYSGSIYINAVLMILIITGGIGFFVWQDIWVFIKNRRHRLHVTSRLALYTTAFLIISGALYFLIIEYHNLNTIGSFSTGHKALASLFQSVTLRTAGFSSINQHGLKESSKFISSILMIIGGSPGSIAGGIKTVTVAVIFFSIWSIIKGRDGIQIMNRSIPLKVLQKALAIAGIMCTLLISFSILLSVTEESIAFTHTFADILYECASALATVGLTTGITPFLTTTGKAIIVIAMFIGRIGPITAIYSLSWTKKNNAITLAETEVLIG